MDVARKVIPNISQMIKEYRFQVYQVHPIKDTEFLCVRPYKIVPGILYWGFYLKRDEIPETYHWHLDAVTMYLYKNINDRRVYIYDVLDENVYNETFEKGLYEMLDDGMQLDDIFDILMV